MRKKGTPRTRQSPLTLAAFRPWGSSQDARRAGSTDEHTDDSADVDSGAAIAPRNGAGPVRGAVFMVWQVTRYARPRRIRLVAYGARLERGLG